MSRNRELRKPGEFGVWDFNIDGELVENGLKSAAENDCERRSEGRTVENTFG